MKIIVLFLLCVSCVSFQKKENKPQKTIQPIDELRVKAENYKNWTAELELENGVLPQFRCDSLLFQSLYEIATDGDLDITIYQGKPGQWFRSFQHNCFYRDNDGNPVLNGSRTTISRDMILGLLHWIWEHKDLTMVEDLISWGRSASPKWFMGDGPNFLERETRTHMRGPLLGTMFEIAYRLGGEDNPIRHFPYRATGKANGFHLHLEVTHTFLRGLIFDGLTKSELASIERASNKQQDNAYYNAVYNYFKDGDQEKSIAMLLNKKLFPIDSLPSGQDRCSDYIYQRDDDRDNLDPKADDWKPCEDGSNVTHPGVDFLWVYKIIDR